MTRTSPDHWRAPLPWRAVVSTSRRVKHWRREIRDGRNETIAVVYTTEADAQLIAAAPRLLDACKAIATAVACRDPARQREALEHAAALAAEVQS